MRAREGSDALVTRGLFKTYETGAASVRALRGVDFRVSVGDFVAIMGPSGCGKSTLLNLVAALDQPDEGAIAVAGSRVERLSAAQSARMRRKHIGMIFQFFELVPQMSALENVKLAALLSGASAADSERRAITLLDTLGLLGRAGDLPHTLSGGQRQRVAIARALANRPTLLLADEPTGALDSGGAREIIELLQRLHRDGQTIVLVTHDPEVAAAALRVVHMRDGCLEAGPGKDMADGGGPA
ncbi:ABC transporter ATP-binding protein [Streptomyces sp. NBC_00467]|uniref:ABC transporter ATP-binding protein n=1 Tax=Streptomyces sp. NBC_00467 TaxID=2975752 RepID=UPI002E1857E3